MERACARALEQFRARRTWAGTAPDEAEALLERVHARLQPPADAAGQRHALVERIQQVLRTMPDFRPDGGYGRGRHRRDPPGECLATVELFGSFCSGLWHVGSDIDLTLMGSWRDRNKVVHPMHTMEYYQLREMLRRVLWALVDNGVAQQEELIFRARVPVIAFVDPHTGVPVDIVVCNAGGVFKSHFTRELCLFDERLPKLYRLVKLWAEAHGLNNPKAGTLNSWSLFNAVLFHLQAQGAVPPLWQLLQDHPDEGPRPLEVDPREGRQPDAPCELLDVAAERIGSDELQVRHLGRGDGSLLLLLSGFLVRFREVLTRWLREQQSTEERMSTFFGAWSFGGPEWRAPYLVSFEDPFDSTDNTARTLGTAAKNDGGGRLLLSVLEAGVSAFTTLTSDADVAGLMQVLFRQPVETIRGRRYAPIALLERTREQDERQRRALREQEQRQQQQDQQQQVIMTGIALLNV